MMLSADNLTLPHRLAGITAALRPGEITAICGPNGAGKSSLLTTLAGLLAPATGQVILDDQPLATVSPRSRAQAIGYLPQSAEVAWDVDVATLVGLGRLPWRASAAENAAATTAALADMDLARFATRPLSQLSGGERARALLARVLAGQPRWILADEPLANLDLAHQATLLRHFRALAEAGRGVVLVVHDLALAMNHADRVLVLEHGTLAADGPPVAALGEAVVAKVWGVKTRWLGEPGAKALAVT